MIKCPNCGAEIENDVAKCLYCNYINFEGAQKEYFKELNKLKDNLEEIKEEPSKALKRGLSGGAKVILRTLAVIFAFAVIVAIVLMVSLKKSPKMYLSPEEEAAADAYRIVAGEALEAAYNDKDIARLAQIFDKAYSEDRISLWGDVHYETGYAASCYMKLQQCLPNLDKKKIKKREAEEITYYCFYFYYRAYGEDGAAIFDDIRDNEIMTIITDRLGYTIEDMESFRSIVVDAPYVNRSKVYSIVKSHYKNYH